MSDIVVIPLDRLVPNDYFQPRDGGVKEGHVQLLMRTDPATWPPLLVVPNDAGGFDLIDGFHRREAARRLGLSALPCRIDPDADFFTGVAANIAHGLPLTVPDRKDAARWLAEHEPDLSYRELGRRVGLHHETVKRALEQPQTAGGQQRQTTHSDPIARLVRQVERTYHEGSGRAMFGFGKAGSPAPFRKAIEAYQHDDRPSVATALDAFGRASVEAAEPYLREDR